MVEDTIWHNNQYYTMNSPEAKMQKPTGSGFKDLQ